MRIACSTFGCPRTTRVPSLQEPDRPAPGAGRAKADGGSRKQAGKLAPIGAVKHFEVIAKRRQPDPWPGPECRALQPGAKQGQTWARPEVLAPWGRQPCAVCVGEKKWKARVTEGQRLAIHICLRTDHGQRRRERENSASISGAPWLPREIPASPGGFS